MRLKFGDKINCEGKNAIFLRNHKIEGICYIIYKGYEGRSLEIITDLNKGWLTHTKG